MIGCGSSTDVAVVRLTRCCRCYHISAFLLLWSALYSGTHVSALTPVDFTLIKSDSTVTLGCMKDSPNDELRWVRQDHNITNSSKYEILTDAIMSNLTIRNAGEGDVGVYNCFNQTNVDIEVTLNSVPFNDSRIVKSISLIEGETAVLVCSGWGWPIPTVFWTREPYLDHVYGVSDPGVTFADAITPYNVTIRNGKMNISDMKQNDQMDYRCYINNKYGNATITTYVRVKDRLAAVWPFIGIIVEVIIFVIFIIVCEIKRRKKQEEELAQEDPKSK